MPTKRSKKVSPGIRGKPMKKGVRSPTAHRTLEQSQAHGDPKTGYQRKKKTYRKKLGQLPKAPKGMDRGHKKAASKGGKTTKANVRPQKRSANRGHGMTRGKKANAGKKVRKR
jgi:hypothetical protein